MPRISFDKAIGGLLASGALFATMYAAIVMGNEQAMGALVAVLAAAVGFYLRSKIQDSRG